MLYVVVMAHLRANLHDGDNGSKILKCTSDSFMLIRCSPSSLLRGGIRRVPGGVLLTTGTTAPGTEVYYIHTLMKTTIWCRRLVF